MAGHGGQGHQLEQPPARGQHQPHQPRITSFCVEKPSLLIFVSATQFHVYLPWDIAIAQLV